MVEEVKKQPTLPRNVLRDIYLFCGKDKTMRGDEAELFTNSVIQILW